ncbi:MAG TPA: hypothetical protein VNT32_10730 [Thermoleophilaceae bacterium]|nr:hypothetical protein [Thermoleophilaceae bacterium]
MRKTALALGAVLAATALGGTGASAHPEQHGPDEGHLLGSGAWGNMHLLDRVDVTDTPNTVADVAVSPDGDYAYVAHWGEPDCAANSEAGGQNSPDAGAHVIDIRDPSNAQKIGFIPHSQDSRPGEGMQVVDIATKAFSGRMLVMNNEQCGKNGKGGVSLYNVTNPRKPTKLSEHFGDRGFGDTNDIHSSWAWQDGGRAYVVMTDNFEAADLDILDVTNPKRPRLIAEYNLNTYIPGGIDQQSIGLQESSLHDMVVKRIDGRQIMLVSYWDGGYVQLDVTDPANAQFVSETDYANPDPELLESAGKALPPEGNGHQAEYTLDDRFFIATDEDFSPYRSVFTIDTGDHAGSYPAGEFGWTVPIRQLSDGKLNGPTVYGGYGCPGDRAGVPSAEAVFPVVAPGEERILVLQRGPVEDPSASGGACFFSEKVETAQLKGYDGAIVANHHVGAQSGSAPDAYICGSMGHDFTVAIPGTCIGHRSMHLMFDDEPAYETPYAGNEPAIGTVGERVSFTPDFDGWGYVHLFGRESAQGLDTFAIDEAHQEDKASGFGDLTVHEVATDKGDASRAYLSYYSGGMRAIEIQCSDPSDETTCELVETGGYLDPDGNDFWGVETFSKGGRTFVLGSDMDDGLWIFEADDHDHGG